MRRGLVSIALGLCLGSVYGIARLVFREPDYGRPPRLAAAVDGGSMAKFLENPGERATILRWVEDGAPKSDWPEVSAVFETRCVTCHFTDDSAFEVLAFDRYETAARAAEVRPVLEEKIAGGTMGEYLETAAELATLTAWIERGAPEDDWPRARSILAEHCVQCHNPEGVAGIPSLESYAPVARLARLPEPEGLPLTSYAAPGVGLFLSLLLAATARRPSG